MTITTVRGPIADIRTNIYGKRIRKKQLKEAVQTDQKDIVVTMDFELARTVGVVQSLDLDEQYTLWATMLIDLDPAIFEAYTLFGVAAFRPSKKDGVTVTIPMIGLTERPDNLFLSGLNVVGFRP